MTVFASVTNSGDETAQSCRVSPAGSTVVSVSYQTTDANNALTGFENQPFTLAPGATQGLLLTFRSTVAVFGALPLTFRCVGAVSAAEVTALPRTGVNVPILHFASTAQTFRPADIIPIAVTPSNDAVVRLPSAGGQQVMVAAAVNLGAAHRIEIRPTSDLFALPTQQNIGVSPYRFAEFGSWKHQPYNLLICETDSSGNCLAPFASSLTVDWAANQTRFFTVLVRGFAGSGVPFLPDVVRSILEFRYATGGTAGAFVGNVVGSASTAVTGPTPPTTPGAPPYGVYAHLWRDANGSPVTSGQVTFQGTSVIIPPDPGSTAIAKLFYSGSFQYHNQASILVGDIVSTGVDTFTMPSVKTASLGGGFSPARPGSFAINPGIVSQKNFIIGNHGRNTSSGEAPEYVGEFRMSPTPQIYDNPVTFQQLAGAYALGFSVGASTQPAGTMTINGAGTVAFSYRGCNGLGSLTAVEPNKAVFVLNVTMDACTATQISRQVYRVPFIYVGDRVDPFTGAPTTPQTLRNMAYILLFNGTGASDLLHVWLQ